VLIYGPRSCIDGVGGYDVVFSPIYDESRCCLLSLERSSSRTSFGRLISKYWTVGVGSYANDGEYDDQVEVGTKREGGSIDYDTNRKHG